MPEAEDADAEVDVFAEAHGRESAQGVIDLAPHAHVETARIELVHLLPSAPDAARGEERRHGVVDGFLQGRERGMGAVRSSESVTRLTPQFAVDRLHIAGRHDDVGVEDEQIIALRPPGGIVAGLSGTGIGFLEIVHVQPVGILADHLGAGGGGSVVDHDDLETGRGLCGEALQQFVHFVGTVVDGNKE